VITHRLVPLVTLVGFLSATLPAGLASADVAFDKSQSSALFKEGRKLLDEGKFDEACPKLAESHRLDPGGGVVLALALCREGQGKLASAVVAYREALFFAKRDKRADRQKVAEQKLAELEPKLSHLTVRVEPAALQQGVVVRVDGNVLPAASYGLAVAVDGGSHTVEASAEGFTPRSFTLDVGKASDQREVTVPALAPAPTAKVAPTPMPTPTPTPPKDGAPRASVLPKVGVGFMVVGGLALVGGAVFGFRALGNAKDVADACPDGVCRDPADVERNDVVKRDARLSDILLISGAVLCGAGITLWLVGRPSAPATLTFTPVTSPTLLGGSFVARF
jgi:hypothetical protein